MPVYFILALFSIAVLIFAPNDLNKTFLATTSLSMLIAIVCHIFSKKEKNYLTPDILFLIGFFIVHFQWPLQYSLGIEPDLPNRIWVSKSVVAYSTALSLIGGAFWLLGFNFPLTTSKKGIFYQFYYRMRLLPLSQRQASQLINLSTFLFIGFLTFVGASFLSGVYLGTANWGGGATYIYLFFSITIIMAITAEVKLKSSLFTGSILRWLPRWNKRLLLLVLAYMTLFTYIGDRGGPLQTMLAAAVLIASTTRPIKLKELLILIFFGALIMTIVGLGRTSDTSDTRGMLTRGLEGLNATGGFKWYQASQELADSNRTLYKAVSNTAETNEYFYGKMFLGNLLSVVPFGQTAYLSITNDQKHELNSSDYITYLTYGENPTSGEGTSIIADIYLNFGVPGVALLMFLLGKIYSNITDNLKNRSDFLSLFAMATIGSLALYQGRAEYFVWLRPLAWGTTLYYILHLLQNRKVKQN